MKFFAVANLKLKKRKTSGLSFQSVTTSAGLTRSPRGVRRNVTTPASGNRDLNTVATATATATATGRRKGKGKGRLMRLRNLPAKKSVRLNSIAPTTASTASTLSGSTIDVTLQIQLVDEDINNTVARIGALQPTVNKVNKAIEAATTYAEWSRLSAQLEDLRIDKQNLVKREERLRRKKELLLIQQNWMLTQRVIEPALAGNNVLAPVAAPATAANVGIPTLPPRLDSVQGSFRRMLAEIGVTDSVSDAAAFRHQGVQATSLRDPTFKKLALLERAENVDETLRLVFNVFAERNKPAVVTIPAGPGQGKSELVSRIVENCDAFIAKYNANPSTAKVESDTWLACAVAFNFETDLSPGELALAKLHNSERFYENMICCRLIYIWLADKKKHPSYLTFLPRLLTACQRASDVMLSGIEFTLRNVVSLISKLAGRPKVMVFVDDSLRPLDGSDIVQRVVLSSLSHLQYSGMVLIFTTTRQRPFLQNANRPILGVQMNCLTVTSSCALIEAMVLVVTIAPSFCFDKCQRDKVYRRGLVRMLARFSGGVPRLCEYAAIAIKGVGSTYDVAVMDFMYKSYFEGHGAQMKPIPREVVVLSILGVHLSPDAECTVHRSRASNDTIDTLISSGTVVRQASGMLYLPPYLLRHYCDPVKPPFNLQKHVTTGLTLPTAVDVGATPEDEIMVHELRTLLDCVFPCAGGRQFQHFDRLQTRVVRIARSQIIDDVSSGSVSLTSEHYGRLWKVEDGVIKGEVLFRKQHVDWRRASLENYFGPSSVSTVDETHLSARYDFSAPFSEQDEMFDSIPKYDASPAAVAYLTSRQFYPRDKTYIGFDWFCVVVQQVTGRLVVVATETRFSANLVSGSKAIDYDFDILKKCQVTRSAFAAAGWDETQVIFRLVAHRQLPVLEPEMLEKFPPNTMICDPNRLLTSYAPSISAMFGL